MKQVVIIKDTHRGLLYKDGVLVEVLEAGHYNVPPPLNLGFYRRPTTEIVLVDIRERDLTIKGQEILTSDKVAIRVSIVVQFRVVDPRAALHNVVNFEDRLYTDVQLAARRSLASTKLEEILTDRNRLSEDILRDVKESAANYGVNISRADVKDLIFPGNLQEIMNRVLAAERLGEAQLIEARTRSEMHTLEAASKARAQELEAESHARAALHSAQNEAEVQRLQTQSELESLQARQATAAAYTEHPALLRLAELEALRELAQSSNAKLYISFDRDTKNLRDEGG